MISSVTKIALLTTDSVPLVGGVANYLHNLSAEVAHYAEVLTYSTVPSSSEYDARLPYPVERLPATRLLGQRFGDGFPPLRKLNTATWRLQRPAAARRLVKNIRERFSPDHLIIGRWEEQSHFWCQACHAEKISYTLIVHGLELVETVPATWASRRMQDLLNAHLVIPNSRATREIVRSFGVSDQRVYLLSPGVNPEALQALPKPALSQVLGKLGLNETPYLLTLTRLVARKGIDLAMRAFAEISREMPDLIYVIAGTGLEEQGLKALAGELQLDDRIIFTGAVDDLTKRTLLQSCELFVMPNRPLPGDMEGFGIVFLEAALFGRAVIGGDNGGVSDAVLNGQTGLLVDTSSSHEPLLDAMATLLRQPDLARRLGETARHRVLREFDWAHLAAGLLRRLDNGRGALPPPSDPTAK